MNTIKLDEVLWKHEMRIDYRLHAYKVMRWVYRLEESWILYNNIEVSGINNKYIIPENEFTKMCQKLSINCFADIRRRLRSREFVSDEIKRRDRRIYA